MTANCVRVCNVVYYYHVTFNKDNNKRLPIVYVFTTLYTIIMLHLIKIRTNDCQLCTCLQRCTLLSCYI